MPALSTLTALHVHGQVLQPIYEKLVLSNVSTQSLSLELSLTEPFSLCEAPGSFSSATIKVHPPAALASTRGCRSRRLSEDAGLSSTRLSVFQAASLGVGEQAVAWVCFSPPTCVDLVSKVLDEVSPL